MRIVLRGIAIVGIVARLVLAAIDDTSAWQALEGFGSSGVVAAIVLALGLLFRAKLRTIRASAGDLVVPIALALTAEGAIGYLGSALAFFDAGPVVAIGALALSLTLSVVLLTAVWTVSAAWTTLLVLEATAGRTPDLVGSLYRVPRVLAATFVVNALGVVVLLAGVGLLVAPALSSKAGSAAPLVVLVVLVVLISVAWNVATAGLLPAALAAPRLWPPAIGAGFRLARERWRRWVLPVVVQLVLLGAVTYVWGTAVRVERKGFETKTFVSTRTLMNADAFWAGAYEERSRWISTIAVVKDKSPSSTLLLLARAAGFVLALAVRLRVARDVTARAAAEIPSR